MRQMIPESVQRLCVNECSGLTFLLQIHDLCWPTGFLKHIVEKRLFESETRPFGRSFPLPAQGGHPLTQLEQRYEASDQRRLAGDRESAIAMFVIMPSANLEHPTKLRHDHLTLSTKLGDEEGSQAFQCESPEAVVIIAIVAPLDIIGDFRLFISISCHSMPSFSSICTPSCPLKYSSGG